ncbi:MAG: efflux RND transporter periplasmic adaptor subunit [Saprospiraceae bacterium]|nr:efflux RND transporter periplasmic adaptor subunit [Saprospiraceae bacterium]
MIRIKDKFVIPVALTILLLSVACSPNEEKSAAEQELSPVEVRLEKPTALGETGINYFSVSGKLESDRIAHISSRMMGNVARVFIREGKKVKQGDLLVQIHSNDLIAQRDRIDASMAEARAAQANAKLFHDRFQALLAQGSASPSEYDQVKLQLDLANARIDQIEHSRRELNVMIAETQVRSPFDGSITRVYAEVGNLATPGTPLVVVESTDELVLRVEVPESEISNIDRKQSVLIQLQHSKDTVRGTVDQINPSSGLSGSQYDVEILPDRKAPVVHTWKAGMYANAQIRKLRCDTSFASSLKRIVVPRSALVERGQLTGIYTVSDGGKAVLRWVRTGKEYAGQVEVLSGLNVTESFVREADSRLFNGAAVTVK